MNKKIIINYELNESELKEAVAFYLKEKHKIEDIKLEKIEFDSSFNDGTCYDFVAYIKNATNVIL